MLEKLIEYDDTKWYPWKISGLCKVYLGNATEGIEDLKKALSLAPKSLNPLSKESKWRREIKETLKFAKDHQASWLRKKFGGKDKIPRVGREIVYVKTKKCYNCRGTGIVDQLRNLPCRVCDGAGQIEA